MARFLRLLLEAGADVNARLCAPRLPISPRLPIPPLHVLAHLPDTPLLRGVVGALAALPPGVLDWTPRIFRMAGASGAGEPTDYLMQASSSFLRAALTAGGQPARHLSPGACHAPLLHMSVASGDVPGALVLLEAGADASEEAVMHPGGPPMAPWELLLEEAEQVQMHATARNLRAVGLVSGATTFLDIPGAAYAMRRSASDPQAAAEHEAVLVRLVEAMERQLAPKRESADEAEAAAAAEAIKALRGVRVAGKSRGGGGGGW